MLEQALALVMHAHRDIPRHLRGPALTFWVFQVLRDYAATLEEGKSRHRPALKALLDEAVELERAVGRIEMVFGHNDLLPGNFLHDGTADVADRLGLCRLGLAAVRSWGASRPTADWIRARRAWMLEAYFATAPEADLWHRYRAMKAAAALREAMWSMVQEIHSAPRLRLQGLHGGISGHLSSGPVGGAGVLKA